MPRRPVMVHLGIRAPRSLIAALDKAARKAGKDRSEYLREIIKKATGG